MNTNKKIIALVVLILVLGIVFWRQNIFERTLGRSVGDGQSKFSVENLRGESENVLPKNTILEINQERYEGEIKEATSVYDFMAKLRNEGKITFTEKNYVGIGKFIDRINGVENSRDKSWIYYVNGREAEMGVSNYKINKGDVVSWKYEKNY